MIPHQSYLKRRITESYSLHSVVVSAKFKYWSILLINSLILKVII